MRAIRAVTSSPRTVTLGRAATENRSVTAINTAIAVHRSTFPIVGPRNTGGGGGPRWALSGVWVCEFAVVGGVLPMMGVAPADPKAKAVPQRAGVMLSVDEKPAEWSPDTFSRCQCGRSDRRPGPGSPHQSGWRR